MRHPTVVIGLLGPTLDRGCGPERWNAWRPTVSIFQHEELLIGRLELLHGPRSALLARTIAEDVVTVSPETRVVLHELELQDAWDFEEVYGALHDFVRAYPFDPTAEDYLVHITTGTHVAQICLFLLAESRHLPARILQASPPAEQRGRSPGTFRIIDLDLSRYDRLAQRFHSEHVEGRDFLKSGIATRNAHFNRVIEQIEHIAIHGADPLLLMGPTGAGKSQLARRVYELKRLRRQLQGPFVEVNCATIRGDAAMSTLFGHTRGAFTGAISARPGLLREAHGGLLFLDEIGELGPDEQAMLLRAIEDKRFLPVGSDNEVQSDFQLICGTNQDLPAAVHTGRFREDLLARINLWTFRLPPLTERREDLEPNLAYELDQLAQRTGRQFRFNKEAAARFLGFATSPRALWSANFRDLNAAVRRMATFAPSGRITTEVVDEEIRRLEGAWAPAASPHPALAGADVDLTRILDPARLAALDLFDRLQLAAVLGICRRSSSLSDAGRTLFAASRERRSSTNDADRLRKYLARFGLSWGDVRSEVGA